MSIVSSGCEGINGLINQPIGDARIVRQFGGEGAVAVVPGAPLFLEQQPRGEARLAPALIGLQFHNAPILAEPVGRRKEEKFGGVWGIKTESRTPKTEGSPKVESGDC